MSEYISNGESALSIRGKLNDSLITPAEFSYSGNVVSITAPENAKYISFIATIDYSPSYTYNLNGEAVKVRGVSSDDTSLLWKNGNYVLSVINDNEICIFYLQNAKSVFVEKNDRIEYDNAQDNLQYLSNTNNTIIQSYPIAKDQTVNAGQVVDILNGEVLSKYQKKDTIAGDLPVGAYINVKEGETTARYIVVHQGKPSSMYEDSCDGTWIMRERCLNEAMSFDSGNINKLDGSDISGWLESTFFNTIDSGIKSGIKNVKIPYRQGGLDGTNYSGADGFQCHCFLPSMYELGFIKDEPGYTYSNGIPIDGAKLDYFLSGSSTASNNERKAEKTEGGATAYFTRSPYTNLTTDMWYIRTDGLGDLSRADSSHYIRPVFILEKNYIVSSIDINIPSQAIALQGGSAGDTIDVIFQGVVKLSGITQGQKITSPGVQGFGAMDGWLSVFPYWTPCAKSAYGSYVGTGSYGQSNPTEIVTPFRPLLVVVLQSTSDNPFGGTFIYPTQYGKLWTDYDSSGTINLIWDENSFKIWDNINEIRQFNSSRSTYYWVAFGY